MRNAHKKADPTARGVAAMSEAMQAYHPFFGQVWAEISAESLRFVSQRLEEDLRAQQELLACRAPADLARLQAEYFQKAMTQYTQEAQRMFEIMTDATGKTVAQTRTGKRRDFDDVPV